MATKNYDHNLEVNGQYLLGVINSLNEDDVRPFRDQHGLATIDPNAWYPVDQIVAFYDDLEAAPNGMFDLVAIGLNIVKHIEYPPQIKTMQDALTMARHMHYAGWRKGDPGDLQVEVLSDNHARFTFTRLPLPTDLVYGLCYGMLKRFAPPTARFTVTQQTRGDSLIYDLKW